MNPVSHKIFRLMLCCLFLVTLLPMSLSQAARPQDFQWKATLKGETKTGEPARVPLSATVMAKTRSSFQDLRVFNSREVEVPYVIYEDIVPTIPEKTFSFHVKDFLESETADQFIIEKPQGSEKFEALEILTPVRDFRKNVRVEGSPDGRSWAVLAEDAIFDYSSRVNLRKTSIQLPETDSSFIRITLDKEPIGPTEGDQIRLKYQDLEFSSSNTQSSHFKVDGFIGRWGGRKPDSQVEDSLTFKQPVVSNDETGNSRIELGEIHLPLSTITLEVEEMFFSRPIEVQVSQTSDASTYRSVCYGVIHRIPGAAQGCLTLNVDLDQTSFLRLLVKNGDNPPLTYRSISIAWRQKYLYFFPTQLEIYSIFIGNPDIGNPNYESAHLIANDAIKLRRIPNWTTGELETNPDYTPSLNDEERHQLQRWVLNVLVAALLFGLAIWGVALLRKLPITV